LRRLEDFPESGRIIPEFPELPYREVIVSPYRFFYKIKEETIWIVAVWHGAQLPRKPEIKLPTHQRRARK
jgi:plasmid stabilization system protein ParE